MSKIKFTLTAILLAASVGTGRAGDDDRFLYFATTDPFVSPETPATKNDVHLFGGVFAEDTFGGALRFWEAEYADNYTVGAALGRDFSELGLGFVLGGVAGAAIRFGDEEDASGELWAGLRLRHQGLVVGDVAIAPGLAAGFSVVTGPTEIERRREERYNGDATFLGFVSPEIALRFRQAPNLELVYRLHHRSGGDGTFGNFGEGSNASTIGLRYRF
ncbi:hypothetical protein [Nitratireductor luteus]|uniref:hypothetical protein n=1 Tax=Nitratireductor luteus TaxID=2976980 RepID=UPI002240CFB5|nr:hypothetical protein [Nitratireductor luteus]